MYERMRIKPGVDLETGNKVWLVYDDEGCIARKPTRAAALAVVQEIEGPPQKREKEEDHVRI